jgi:hypothetical protein
MKLSLDLSGFHSPASYHIKLIYQNPQMSNRTVSSSYCEEAESLISPLHPNQITPSTLDFQKEQYTGKEHKGGTQHKT